MPGSQTCQRLFEDFAGMIFIGVGNKLDGPRAGVNQVKIVPSRSCLPAIPVITLKVGEIFKRSCRRGRNIRLAIDFNAELTGVVFVLVFAVGKNQR